MSLMGFYNLVTTLNADCYKVVATWYSLKVDIKLPEDGTVEEANVCNNVQWYTCPMALADRYTNWYPLLLIDENSSMTP